MNDQSDDSNAAAPDNLVAQDRFWGATWPTAFLLSIVIACTLPAVALGHGANNDLFRTTVVSIEPAGLPVEVEIQDGDEVRFENLGNEMLELCGYEAKSCEPWVRISPDGVFEDRNSKSFWFNQEADEFGEVPEGVGEGEPEFVRVRRRPAFYAYHDHRVHWMAQETLPPNVDDSDPSPQHVFDGKVSFRYGDTAGTLTTRLEYVGGQTWMQRYGEYLITGAAVVLLVGIFLIDARRRRARRAAAADGEQPSAATPA